MDENLNIIQSNPTTTVKTQEERGDEPDVFLTPKCISPYIENAFEKTISSSPSTDLTKEYYALVPIDSNLLEKELIEQDALSNAFQSIIKSQRNKPTSLSLTSSHSPKTVKHSISCDILNNCQLPKENNVNQPLKPDEQKVIDHTSQKLNSKSNLEPTVSSNREIASSQGVIDKEVEVSSALSPDSLVTDDPSSSSDYLSAAFNYSPGVSTACTSHLNVGDNISRMENNVTSSDSGLENTGLLESMGSHKDVTLTDVSLTESTLHDLTTDEVNDSMSSSLADKNYQRFKKITTSTHSGSSDVNGIFANPPLQSKDAPSYESSKEEKQRQNEEIVILESSSLSSETGSWESVFPPKHADRQICDKFINSERQHSSVGDVGDRNNQASNVKEKFSPSLVTKSPFKSTSCFIDAASLVDEDDDTIKIQVDSKETYRNIVSDILPAPSEPVPCSTAKLDASPNDWSESNDNEDSLEQGDQKDPDSIQKDLSPTIFEMTPITEDSLCTNAFETAVHNEEENKIAKSCEHSDPRIDKEVSHSSNTVFVSYTPHNSIMSIKSSALRQYESEESESDATVVGRENHVNMKKNILKYNESSPIVSGGASIEDHLPQSGSYSGSPITRRKIENIPIVSGAYIPEIEDSSHKKSPRPSNVSAWVVDMSCHSKSDVDKNTSSVTKPGDRTCYNLINESKHNSNDNSNKSRSSIDSDSSEKSSHKFYIDLSSLPDPLPPKKNNVSENTNEKKNIFSMYIDLGDKSTVKEMPARLSSSLNVRKSTVGENKNISKANQNKTGKDSSTEGTPAQFPIISNTNQSTCFFEKYESLCNDPNVSISEIIKIPQECSSKPENIPDPKGFNTKDVDQPAVESNQQNNVSVPKNNDHQCDDVFVKLSDLDKPLQKPNTSMPVDEHKVLEVRMTRSIPENNWSDQNNASAPRSIEVISSFHSENALSLNRLFPHLKNEFSRSMPGILSSRTRSPMRMGVSPSPGEIEEQISDMSEVSSMQSSMCRSVIG